MPSDITGTEILEEEEGTGRRRMRFVKGPLFGNIILGDEINRTPPKTQAALLQAMQEFKVTTAGTDFPLEKPFLVLGTQNPIEQEGTYPLPEAQLDRFMFKVLIDYPSYEEELTIAETTTAGELPKIEAVLDRDGILDIQRTVRKVLIARSVTAYAVQLVRATRPGSEDAPDFVKKYLSWGAGPRLPSSSSRRQGPRFSTAASTFRRTTSATSRPRSCGTGWRRASARRATASAPITSSRNCSTKWRRARRQRRVRAKAGSTSCEE